MAAKDDAWRNYEEVSAYLLDQMASEFGLERVEGKQHIQGSTNWELDAKGVEVGGEGFVIIECRRHTKTKQSQEQVGALAFRIIDTGASGGIYVSPLGFQEGAKKVAAAQGIHEVLIHEDSTPTDYLLQFLNRIFVGMALKGEGTLIADATVLRLDGTPETD